MEASEMLCAEETQPTVSAYDVRVKLFGAVELENNWGRVSEDPERPTLSWLLLKYLLINPDREVPSEELWQGVWPNEADVDRENAAELRRRRLRNMLAPLRLEGRNGLVLFCAGSYKLNPDYRLHADTKAFSEQMRRVRHAPPDSPGGLEACLKALELCRGRFMEYTEEAPWLLHLRKHYVQEFTELACATLKRLEYGDDDRVINLLCRRATAIIPEQEKFHRKFIDYMMEWERQNDLARYIAQLSRRRTPDMEWLEPMKI